MAWIGDLVMSRPGIWVPRPHDQTLVPRLQTWEDLDQLAGLIPRIPNVHGMCALDWSRMQDILAYMVMLATQAPVSTTNLRDIDATPDYALLISLLFKRASKQLDRGLIISFRGPVQTRDPVWVALLQDWEYCHIISKEFIGAYTCAWPIAMHYPQERLTVRSADDDTLVPKMEDDDDLKRLCAALDYGRFPTFSPKERWVLLRLLMFITLVAIKFRIPSPMHLSKGPACIVNLALCCENAVAVATKLIGDDYWTGLVKKQLGYARDASMKIIDDNTMEMFSTWPHKSWLHPDREQ